MTIKKIGLLNDHAPDNAVGEGRVALVPQDVQALVAKGIDVSVEAGAAAGVGFDDAAYATAGAAVQTAAEIGADKQMLISLTPPTEAVLDSADPKTLLFCGELDERMAASRFDLLDRSKIIESPKHQSDEEILGRTAMAEALAPFIATGVMGRLNIRLIGWPKLMRFALRRSGNRDPLSLVVMQDETPYNALDCAGSDCLYVYDSREFMDSKKILKRLAARRTHLFDLAQFEAEQGVESVETYREDHPPFETGGLRLDCAAETGLAAARAGLKALENMPAADIKVLVLGFGAEAQGAVKHMYEAGLENIEVLARKQMLSQQLPERLKAADLIIVATKQPKELAARGPMVTLKTLKKGAVVVDVMGDENAPRPAVAPQVADKGRLLSSPNWARTGASHESTLTLSTQLTDILIGRENIIALTPADYPKGVAQALVTGLTS